MPKIVFDDKIYEFENFESEEELEDTVANFSKKIFGDKTLYFNMKKKVTSRKGNLGSIPDGYLITFFDGSPKLFVVENEISLHDELEIGQQLMKYQATFDEAQYKTKEIIQEKLGIDKQLLNSMEKLQRSTAHPNISELLDEVIFKKPVGYIVVIDEASERLRKVLKVLESPPEIVEVRKYVGQNETLFHFSDFEFAQVKQSTSIKVATVADVDTIVCPAREEGFKEVFLKQNRWYAIRMSAAMIPQIKYLAMYETKPFSGIRWIGYVQDIKPYEDSDKFEIILSEKEQLKNPLKLTADEKKRGIAPRNTRYTKMELIKKAKKFSDLF